MGPSEGELLEPELDPAVAAILARAAEAPELPDARNMARFGDQARKIKIGQICKAIKEDVPPESACWLAGLDPEDLAGEMLRDSEVRIKINQALAVAERALIQKMRAGGKGLDPAKAALEILKHTRDTWRKRANVNLAAQFRDALDELRKRLKGNMSGEQALKIVIDVFSRHV